MRPSSKVFLLSASRSDEIARPSATGSGLFTSYLLRGLDREADLDGNGAVTFQEIARYATDRVSNDARSQGWEQTPTPSYGARPDRFEIVQLSKKR